MDYDVTVNSFFQAFHYGMDPGVARSGRCYLPVPGRQRLANLTAQASEALSLQVEKADLSTVPVSNQLYYHFKTGTLPVVVGGGWGWFPNGAWQRSSTITT